MVPAATLIGNGWRQPPPTSRTHDSRPWSPGIGTAADLRRAHELRGVPVRVATHCTEADVSQQLIETARTRYGCLRLLDDESPGARHRTQPLKAQLMASYGANCVYVVDSGGRLTMDGVRDRVRLPRGNRPGRGDRHSRTRELVPRGSQQHVAVEEGATRVDASLAGLGAGSRQPSTRVFLSLCRRDIWLGNKGGPVRASGCRGRPRAASDGSPRAS